MENGKKIEENKGSKRQNLDLRAVTHGWHGPSYALF